MDELEEDTVKEVVEEVVIHIKMELISQMSPVTLNIQGGPHYQTIQGKVSLRTQYAQTSRRITIGTPTDKSVLKRITRIG